MSSETNSFQVGDRVRVTRSDSAYTGCRGSVAEIPDASDARTIPLGYYVAIDGENGLSRPFLRPDLERIAAVKARRRAARGAPVHKVNE